MWQTRPAVAGFESGTSKLVSDGETKHPAMGRLELGGGMGPCGRDVIVGGGPEVEI